MILRAGLRLPATGIVLTACEGLKQTPAPCERPGSASCLTGPAARAPRTPPNTYVREDQIVPHLAAIAILLADPAGTPARANRGLAQLTSPDGTAALIDQLRAGGVLLTCDPDDRTLRTSGHNALSVTTGRDH